ncbi:MAG: DNA-directed RNA polymerase subunit omega [Oscillospiraceae bacterium]|jgi:DNA-directed RNA polymerase subunit omega|nr:DNA-directed RNA polymerase subunit omega [Oscillospiraceae bacterium]
MYKPSIKNMFNGKESRYSLVIGVAKRAREIVDEADFSGDILEEKPVNIAIKDFKEGKYCISVPDFNENFKNKQNSGKKRT